MQRPRPLPHPPEGTVRPAHAFLPAARRTRRRKGARSILGILALALLITAGGFLATEFLLSGRLVDPMDRCAEAVPSASQAFAAGPMARNGLQVTELNAPTRVETPEGALPGLILCRADAVFSSGARDTMWYALVPATGGRENEFMIHAAPGEMGRRSILALR
ncbi:hypothetical protein J8J14_20595 [Roseomonas sp. SSH11]|uniref:Uncharacterized protein n=1 Tax=Pararoseomonas baculiformis TaxID=2820812 RepID=A0ABS4AJH4_9PROT|nr:hypothetical protein [Pararoseomonas baculiformis]MBP0447180.1 hypothetical protein [Pararoseomonas baculiformis]